MPALHTSRSSPEVPATLYFERSVASIFFVRHTRLQMNTQINGLRPRAERKRIGSGDGIFNAVHRGLLREHSTYISIKQFLRPLRWGPTQDRSYNRPFSAGLFSLCFSQTVPNMGKQCCVYILIHTKNILSVCEQKNTASTLADEAVEGGGHFDPR